MQAIAGLTRTSAGTMRLEDAPLEPKSAADAIRSGIVYATLVDVY